VCTSIPKAVGDSDVALKTIQLRVRLHCYLAVNRRRKGPIELVEQAANFLQLLICEAVIRLAEKVFREIDERRLSVALPPSLRFLRSGGGRHLHFDC
jgi:hypothetical protein